MKSFLLKDKKPIVKWGSLKDNIFFEGQIPDGYSLAVCPSKGIVILDVDKHDGKDGFNNIPAFILKELNKTLNYKTKNDGRHFWLKYTGEKELANKASSKSIDLRTHKGYAVWYEKKDIRSCENLINETSLKLNQWLEKLFSYV